METNTIMNSVSETVPVEDAVSTKAGGKQPLYAPRIPVYPKRVSGTFRRIKWIALTVLLGIYYLLPWLRWDRGPGAPDQAVLIDMPNRRAYFFFIEIWPQEVYYLVGILILAALGLFFATSLAGRVWCGYACPQTVWTDLFMWVERRVEGDRNARMRLDRKPFGLAKAARKLAKHAIWLVIAFLTGGAWIMYFADAPTVLREIFTLQASETIYFFTGFFTVTTYIMAGWAREQVCTYMCPYARFQGAMLDEDSLVVTYQRWRGEPRGKHKKGTSWEGRGHCVDCNQCVAVCPTGIDIRDGQQLECIGCGLCIDACNGVMDKVGLPRGLITFDTAANQQARAAGKPTRYRLARPRTIIYALLMIIIAGTMLWGLTFRTTLEVSVLRDRSPLFVTLSDGDIRNGYTFKVLNMTREARVYTVALSGLDGATLTIIGATPRDDTSAEVTVKPDSVGTYRLYVRLPRDRVTASSLPLSFVVTDQSTGTTALHQTVFRGP